MYEKVIIEEQVKPKSVVKYKCPECGHLESCDTYVDRHRANNHSFLKKIQLSIGSCYYFDSEEKFRVYTEYNDWQGSGWYCEAYDPESMNDCPNLIPIAKEKELLEGNLKNLQNLINEIDGLEVKQC